MSNYQKSNNEGREWMADIRGFVKRPLSFRDLKGWE